MGSSIAFVLITCLLFTTHCYIFSSDLLQVISRNRTRALRQANFYDEVINGQQHIPFAEVCDGRVLIPLGTCNSVYLRCSYEPSGLYITAVVEECPMGKIFNGANCDGANDNCLGTWSKQMEKLNSETTELLSETEFCYRGSGIYISVTSLCSRQAFVCVKENQGFGTACPPGMIMLSQPFGCFAYPPGCAPGKISLEKFAPLRQYAIEKYCLKMHSATRNKMIPSMQLRCNTWSVECGKTMSDIVYCERGMIFDLKTRKCKMRKPEDHCVMPDICKGREWETISLGVCNRHFIYCRGQVLDEFVCAEGYVFYNNQCVPKHQAGDQCWKCRDGEKRHTSFHSCSEYSVCENGRWEERNCLLGMSYFEGEKTCKPDPSCALPMKCKVGKSYRLKCNEYMICIWKGIFEYRICPPFYRWDIEAAKCLPDSNCVPTKEKLCMDGEVIDTFDCDFYHQCFGGKWSKIPCSRSPAGVCTKCRNGRSVSWRTTEECTEGSTLADPQNCVNYAICHGGMWRSARCRFGLFWNQQLHRCDANTDCKAFKRADCIHGQLLVGQLCNEYMECIHGSWITMQCLAGYAFDAIRKQCIVSNACPPPSPLFGGYLSLIEHITNSSLFSGSMTNFEEDERSYHLPVHELPVVQYAKEDKQPYPCQLGKNIRDPYNCKKYFECSLEGYVERYCDDNHGFNEKSGRCEINYHCDLLRCQEGRTMDNKLCGHYRICMNGTWHEAVCKDNQRFANGRCLTTLCSDVSDEESVPQPIPCSSNWNVSTADDTDCKRYFICKNGQIYEQHCTDGTSFDKKRGYCTQDVSCKSTTNCFDGEIRENKQNCDSYEVCKGGKFVLRFCPHGMIYKYEARTCVEGSCVGGNNDICKESGGPTGYRADPLDCHKFYQCAQGKWVSKICPAKLFWNPEKSVCDWPTNVEMCM